MEASRLRVIEFKNQALPLDNAGFRLYILEYSETEG
jgi:hypothetical protein